MSGECDKCGLEDPECHCYLHEIEERVTAIENKLDMRKMDWVKVEERLPPQNVYVLVAHYDCHPKVRMYFVQIAERVGRFWYDNYDGKEITQKGARGLITHWMPLPLAPEFKEENAKTVR